METSGSEQLARLRREERTLRSGGRYSEALIVLEQILAIAPSDQAALVNRIGVLGVMGRDDEIATALRTALKYYPHDGALLQNAGCYYNARGNTERAVEFLKKAIDCGQNDPGVFAMLGVCYGSQRKLIDGVRAFNEALKRSPSLPDALAGLNFVAATIGYSLPRPPLDNAAMANFEAAIRKCGFS